MATQAPPIAFGQQDLYGALGGVGMMPGGVGADVMAGEVSGSVAGAMAGVAGASSTRTASTGFPSPPTDMSSSGTPHDKPVESPSAMAGGGGSRAGTPPHEHEAEPTRKRRRHTRTATGCKQCGQHRVKCPEGPPGTNGRKVACRRCWETDRPCFYPKGGRRIRGQKDGEWVRAEDVIEWPFEAVARLERERDSLDVVDEDEPRAAAGPSRRARRTARFPTATATLSSSPDDDTIELPRVGNDSPAGCSDLLAEALALVAPLAKRARSFSGSTGRTGSAPLPGGSAADLVRALLNPSFDGVLSTFTIASLSGSPMERSVVDYFETNGCTEIVAVNSSSDNWIFSQLFPHVFTMLATPVSASSAKSSSPTPGTESVLVSKRADYGDWLGDIMAGSGEAGTQRELGSGVATLLRDFLHLSFLHMCFIHRSNVEADAARARIWRAEAHSYRQKAGITLLRAQVAFPSQWRTEEYLIGFFVRSIADMLDARHVAINEATIFEIAPGLPTSPLYSTLRELIATYSIMSHASTPFSSAARAPTLSVPPDATGEWSAKFFGFSRRIVRLVPVITGLVAERWALLHPGRGGPTASAAAASPAARAERERDLRSRAEAQLAALGPQWDWDENGFEGGLTARMQRGNEVVRCGLRVMLLTEALNVPLDDPRVEWERKRAIELVADTVPTVMSGYQWPLTIVAIYTPDKAVRGRIHELIRLTLAMGFGRNYRGSDDVLGLCWGVLDSKGRYDNGIAPWREAMAAVGRNLWL